MDAPVFLKLATRSLLRNPRRSLITLVASAVGLAGLLFLWGLIGGMNRQMLANVTGYLTAHIQIHASGFHDNPELDLAFDARGRTLPGVTTGIAAITPRIDGEALVSRGDKTRGMRVIGIDPEREKSTTTIWRAVSEGTYLDAADPDGVLLGHQAAEALGAKLGGEVTLVTQAADGSVGAHRYRVRGVFASGINFIDDAYLFMPLAAAQALFSLEGRITTLAIRLDNVDAVPEFNDRLQGQLGRNYEVLGWNKLLPALADDMAFHEYFTHIILFVVFVVVTLGIANTILMGVMERVREFGIMLALGTTPQQLARSVVYEGALLGLSGALFGSLLGLAIVGWFGRHGINYTRYSTAVQQMPGLTGIVYPGVTAMNVAVLALAIAGMTLLASLYPAWKAGRLAPVEAIQGSSTRANLRGLRQMRSPMSLPAQAMFLRIALRNLARNRRRTLLTLSALGAGLAAQMFLGALGQGFFLEMRNNATDLLTGHAQVEIKGFRTEYDPKLTLSDPDRLLAELRSRPGIVAAAPRVQAMTMIGSPTRSEAVMLYGVDPQAEPTVTRLQEKVREGVYLSPKGAREIVVGRGLAERLNVRLGEKVVVMAATADGSLGSAALRVSGITDTGNDMIDRHIAVTSLQAMRELLGAGPGVSTIALRFSDVAAADTTAAELAPMLHDNREQIVSWKVLLPEVVQMLDLVDVNIAVILVVVFIIVALGVANTLLMAVLERTREFGLQLALGTRPAQIVRTVLYESVLMALLGLGVGLLAGGLIVGYFHHAGFDLTAFAAAARALPGMSSVIHPTIAPKRLVLPIAALLITSIGAALYPAWRAARLDAAEALRRV